MMKEHFANFLVLVIFFGLIGGCVAMGTSYDVWVAEHNYDVRHLPRKEYCYKYGYAPVEKWFGCSSDCCEKSPDSYKKSL